MPPTTSSRRSLPELKKLASTSSKRDFERMVRAFDRPNIIVEDGSWYDYPPRSLIAGPPSNIIMHIKRKTRGRAIMLYLASNGDEMTGMMSGEQRHTLTRLLSKYNKMKRPINVLFYSGGGNDVVGKWDLERFLMPYKDGYTAGQCINKTRLGNKIRQIELAYAELFGIRNQYSPATEIITHTYDIPYASGEGACFLGLKFRVPWLKPAMVRMGIPKGLRHQVCRGLIAPLGESLINLQSHTTAKGKFHAVRTQGTLTSASQWLNEIHPTSAGFKLVSAKVYRKLKQQIGGLPNWD